MLSTFKVAHIESIKKLIKRVCETCRFISYGSQTLSQIEKPVYNMIVSKTTIINRALLVLQDHAS